MLVQVEVSSSRVDFNILENKENICMYWERLLDIEAKKLYKNNTFNEINRFDTIS